MFQHVSIVLGHAIRIKNSSHEIVIIMGSIELFVDMPGGRDGSIHGDIPLGWCHRRNN